VAQDLREDHSSGAFDSFDTGLGSNPYHRMKPRPMLPEPVTSNVRGSSPDTMDATPADLPVRGLVSYSIPEFLRIMDDPIKWDSAGIPGGKTETGPNGRLSTPLKGFLEERRSHKAEAERLAKIKRKLIERGKKSLYLNEVVDREATVEVAETTIMDRETTHHRDESPKPTRTKSNKKVTTAAKEKGKVALPKNAPKTSAGPLETINEHRAEASGTGHGKHRAVLHPEALEQNPPISGFKKYGSQKKAAAPDTNVVKQPSQQTTSGIQGQLPEDSSKQRKTVSEKRKESTKTSSARQKENGGKDIAKTSLPTASRMRKNSAPKNPTSSAPRGIQKHRFTRMIYDDGDSPDPDETIIQKPEEPVLTFSSLMKELGMYKEPTHPENQAVREKSSLGKPSQAKKVTENASLKEHTRDTMDPKIESPSKTPVAKEPSLLDPKAVFRGLSVHKKRPQTQAPPDKRDRREPSSHEGPSKSSGFFSENRDADRPTLRSLTSNSWDDWSKEKEIEHGDEAVPRPFHPTELPESIRDIRPRRTQSDTFSDSGFRSFTLGNHRRPTQFEAADKPLNYGDDPGTPKPSREQETREAVYESGTASQHTVEARNDGSHRQPSEGARYSAWPEGRSSYENLRLPRPNNSDHRFEQPSNLRRSRNPLPPQEQVVARTLDNRGSRDRSPFGNRRRSPERRPSPFGARQTDGARSPAWGGRRFDRGGRRGDRYHPYNRAGSRERTERSYNRAWAPEERGREPRRERAWERNRQHDREREQEHHRENPREHERERDRERSWARERERR
jgi:hypothetical protein